MKTSTLKIVIINLIFFELFSFALIRLFYVTLPPLFYRQKFLPYFIDTESSFTSWHYKDSNTRHIGPKWNVVYNFNSYGARDAERNKKSTDKRFLFLGDSFIEGYGIEENDRLSNRIEKKANIPCLNFGVSGIAQTQMRLIYNDLAKDFDHDVLFLSFYPFNDFRELNYKYRDVYFGDRYRPYLIKDSLGNRETKYYLNEAKESSYHESKHSEVSFRTFIYNTLTAEKTFFAKLWNIFRGITHSGTIAGEVNDRIKHKIKKQEPLNFDIQLNDHHLEHLAVDDWENIEHELSLIKKMSENKDVVLMFIPHPMDFSYRDSLGHTTLVQNKIRNLSEKVGFRYVDFLEELRIHKVKNLYLPNDDHWSKEGNKQASEILLRKLKEFKVLK